MSHSIQPTNTSQSSTQGSSIDSTDQINTSSSADSISLRASESVELCEPGKYLDWSDEMRRQWETLFTIPINTKLCGDWKQSEEYWLRKDQEMLEYLQDWPLSKWIISLKEAREAYDAMQDRYRLRDQGKSVYSNGVPVWWPYADLTTFALSQKSAVSATDSDNLENAKASESRKKSRSTRDIAPSTDGKSTTIPKVKKVAKPAKTNVPQPKSSHMNDSAQNGEQTSRKRDRTSSFVDEVDAKEDVIIDQSSLNDGDYADDDDPQSKKRRKSRPSTSINDQIPEEEVYQRPRVIRDPTPPPYGSGQPELPWQSQWSAEDPEAWDNSLYSPETLHTIKELQMRNANIVAKYMENGKHGASKRKSAALAEGQKVEGEEEKITSSQTPVDQIKLERSERKRSKVKKPRNPDAREQFSGRLSFPDAQNLEAFKETGYGSIDDAVESAMLNPFEQALMNIQVQHDPGDSILANLEIPRISIMDIARTKLQLRHHKILTDEAACAIIDFCPDQLTANRLIQVASETSFGNTAIQIRLGQNGSMLSDSTITKRVSAALVYKETGASTMPEPIKSIPPNPENNGERVITNPATLATINARNQTNLNRACYVKYKAWRAHKRSHFPSKPCTFDLVKASQDYAMYRQEKGQRPIKLKSYQQQPNIRFLQKNASNQSDSKPTRKKRATTATRGRASLSLQDMIGELKANGGQGNNASSQSDANSVPERLPANPVQSSVDSPVSISSEDDSNLDNDASMNDVKNVEDEPENASPASKRKHRRADMSPGTQERFDARSFIQANIQRLKNLVTPATVAKRASDSVEQDEECSEQQRLSMEANDDDEMRGQ